MLDRVELRVKAGNGGRGAVTFRREKYVPFGGPSGGDGGKGGDIIVKADSSISTLRAYKYKRDFKSEDGQPGMSKNMHGKNGEDLTLAVPLGTLIYQKLNDDEKYLIADLEKEGQQVTVARGGNGGYGNAHFATPTNQAPRIAQPGVTGQNLTLIVEMRLIADVGIIGFPNAGKSSLLSALSAAEPKIADYPFTTLEPILGVVDTGDKNTFVLAEIPGLIEGAHSGKGLGHSFLRHAMRTRVMIHLIDGTSPTPVENMIQVNNELALFDASLAKRPQLLAVNKIDLPEVKERVKEIKKAFKEAGLKPFFISAAAGIGLTDLVQEAWKILKEDDSTLKVEVPAPTKVFRPLAVDFSSKIKKRGNTYIVVDPDLEKLLDKFDLEDPEQITEFNKRLEKLGINKLMESAGAKSGDTVITGNMEWTWYKDDNRHHGGDV